MSERIHGSNGNDHTELSVFELGSDENALSPENLTDMQILDFFLAEATHMISARSSDSVSAIVNRLIGRNAVETENKLQEKWRIRTRRLMEASENVDENELFEDVIWARIAQSLALSTARAKDLSGQRKALRDLLEIRSAVVANNSLATEDNEACWHLLVMKLSQQ